MLKKTLLSLMLASALFLGFSFSSPVMACPNCGCQAAEQVKCQCGKCEKCKKTCQCKKCECKGECKCKTK